MHLPSPLEVRLTGITTLPGEPRVLLETTDPQTGKTERPPPLRNGEHFKAITIVAIDPVNSRVQIKIGTVARTLDFESHGIKLVPSNSTTPAPPPLGRVIL